MLSEQVVSLFDTALNSPEGAVITVYFTSESIRESVRVRLISLKTKYEKSVRKTAPLVISRISSSSSYPGISITRVADSRFTAFIKLPGEATKSLTLSKIERPTDVNIPVISEEDQERERITKLLREDGKTEDEIAAFFDGVTDENSIISESELEDFNLEELMKED